MTNRVIFVRQTDDRQIDVAPFVFSCLIFWLNISFNRIMTFGFAQIGLDSKIIHMIPMYKSKWRENVVPLCIYSYVQLWVIEG